MPNIIFVDTNVFLRVIVNDNKKMFGECMSVLESAKNGIFFLTTSHLVLAEVAWTLSSHYKVPKSVVVNSLGSISTIPNIQLVDTYQLPVALKLYQKYPVKYVDAMVSSIPEIYEHKWPVLSYDRDFDKLGVKRVEPKDLL